ncbi:hypothetical protein T09_5863 [Trichinella sp. T9]|nr:hypothetical protein T09_5863 [Trichinella sp. T9]
MTTDPLQTNQCNDKANNYHFDPDGLFEPCGCDKQCRLSLIGRSQFTCKYHFSLMQEIHSNCTYNVFSTNNAIEQTLAIGHLVVRLAPFVQWPRGVGDNYVGEINARHGSRCRWTVIDHQVNNGQGANSGQPLSRLSDQLPPFHRLLSARFGQVGTDKSASGQVCVKRKPPARFSFR